MRLGKSGVWSLESGVWSLESGVWSLESGVWSLESGVWSLESGVWSEDVEPLKGATKQALLRPVTPTQVGHHHRKIAPIALRSA